jgi:hypothetical protein
MQEVVLKRVQARMTYFFIYLPARGGGSGAAPRSDGQIELALLCW